MAQPIVTVTESEFSFLVKYKSGYQCRVYKPTDDAALGWLERGQAKTKDEAVAVADKALFGL